MMVADKIIDNQSGFIKSIRRTFLLGVVVTIPGVLLILGVVWLFNLVDGISQPIIGLLFGHTITGLGILLTLLFIYLAGIVVSNAIGKNIVKFGESLVKKLPVLGQLYSGVKQVADTIAGTNAFKSAFREVVLVEYPTPGIFTIGYITNKLKDLAGEPFISIYLPTAPTPQTGVWILASEDQIFDTNLSIQQSIEMTISAGLLTPERITMRRRTSIR